MPTATNAAITSQHIRANATIGASTIAVGPAIACPRKKVTGLVPRIVVTWTGWARSKQNTIQPHYSVRTIIYWRPGHGRRNKSPWTGGTAAKVP